MIIIYLVAIRNNKIKKNKKKLRKVLTRFLKDDNIMLRNVIFCGGDIVEKTKISCFSGIKGKNKRKGYDL